MIKVGQKIIRNLNENRDVLLKKTKGVIKYVDEHHVIVMWIGILARDIYDLEEFKEDLRTYVYSIECVPSVEEQLKDLGWSIKNLKYNIDFYNIELDINYDKNCQILKMSNESIINKKDLKLILQYIEENEK